MDRDRSASGMLVIAGIALFGAAVLVMLWRAPHFESRSPQVPSGWPKRALRLVSLDLHEFPGGTEAAIEQLAHIQPDILMLQGADGRDAARLTSSIGADPQHGSAFYPAQNINGPSSTWGNLIISKFPLFESRSIPNRGPSFGVWAVAIVDGQKFYVASAHFSESPSAERDAVHNEIDSLIAAHRQLGSPPLLLAIRGLSMDRADWGALAQAGMAPALRINPLAAVRPHHMILMTQTRNVASTEVNSAGMVIVNTAAQK